MVFKKTVTAEPEDDADSTIVTTTDTSTDTPTETPTDTTADTTVDTTTVTTADITTEVTTLQSSDDISDSCGLRKADPAKKIGKGVKGMGRIVGGVDAEPNEFPWQISLQLSKPKKNLTLHFCGGAIVNEHWIVTASHCLDILKGKEKHLIVKMGSNEMYDKNAPKYSVHRFVLHEDWDRKTQVNDIAVLKVKEKIQFKVNDKNVYEVNSICLPPPTHQPKGLATLSGFGQTGITEGQSDYLQKLDISIFDHDKCKKNYKKYLDINDMKICAGGKGGQDICMGDSGGPLVQDIDNKVNLIGIVSFSYPCAVKDMPGVYTKVSNYVDWIKEHTKG